MIACGDAWTHRARPYNSSVVKIGLDFGTTRIVVAAVDRGNYPLVNFEAPGGRVHDWFPAVLTVSKGHRAYGWEALELQGKPGWVIVRSLKRFLKSAGPHRVVEVGGAQPNPGPIQAASVA